MKTHPIFSAIAISIAAAPSSVNAQTILASWDTWGDSAVSDGIDPDFSAEGVTVTITSENDALRDIVERGSTDGTFGNFDGASPDDDTALRMHKLNGSTLEINVTNNSGESLPFNTLYFDGVFTNDSFRDFEVVWVGSDEVESDVLDSGSIETDTNDVGFIADFDDLEVNVSSITLEDGDEGFFRITFTGGINNGQGISPNSASTLDNFAISVGGSNLPSSDSPSITEFDYDPLTNSVILTWTSKPQASYVAKISNDLVDWSIDIGDGLNMEGSDENPDDGNLLTKTFNLEDFAVSGISKLFFRVEVE